MSPCLQSLKSIWPLGSEHVQLRRASGLQPREEELAGKGETLELFGGHMRTLDSASGAGEGGGGGGGGGGAMPSTLYTLPSTVLDRFGLYCKVVFVPVGVAFGHGTAASVSHVEGVLPSLNQTDRATNFCILFACFRSFACKAL